MSEQQKRTSPQQDEPQQRTDGRTAEERSFDLGRLSENALGYLEAKGKLFLLETEEGAKEWIAGMTVGVVLLSILGLVVIFFSAGAAVLINSYTHDSWGFVVVGSFHLLNFTLILVFNDFIKDRLKEGIDFVMSKPEPKGGLPEKRKAEPTEKADS